MPAMQIGPTVPAIRGARSRIAAVARRAAALLMMMACVSQPPALAQGTGGAQGPGDAPGKDPAPGTELRLAALTSPELAARVAAGSRTVLVPIGGTEQNGPYMTLGKHNDRAEALAQAIAARLGNALVAPVVAYVPEGALAPPTGHMRYPGTLTVPVAAFEATLESIAQSLKLAGFRDIVFLGDHGGYQSSLARVAARLDRAWAGTPARAHALPEYYRAAEAFSKALARQGHAPAEIGSHAGLADTSLSLAAAPQSVRAGELARAARAPHAPLPGVQGDPRHASAALGAEGVDAILRSSVEAIKRATAAR